MSMFSKNYSIQGLAAPVHSSAPSVKRIALGLFAVPVFLVLGACNSAPVLPSIVLHDADSGSKLGSRAEQAYQQGRWGAAENLYQELAEKNPEQTALWVRAGNMRLRQNNYEGALEAYQAAVAAAPDVKAKAHYNMATSYLLLARQSLLEARAKLPERDLGQAIIDQKISQFDVLIYGPVGGITMPATGVFQ